MSTYEFNSEEVDKMLSIMKKRGYILSAVRPNTKQSVLIEDFLSEFWDYEKSPCVKELALEGKILSRSHVKNERSRVENYWIPELKGMTIGSLTNEILKQIVSKRKIQSLAGKPLMVLLKLSLPRSNGQFVINILKIFLLMDLKLKIYPNQKKPGRKIFTAVPEGDGRVAVFSWNRLQWDMKK